MLGLVVMAKMSSTWASRRKVLLELVVDVMASPKAETELTIELSSSPLVETAAAQSHVRVLE
jgi:hypothetical protein